MATTAVYKITNRLNDKIYIGQTTRPCQRFAEHTWKGSKSRILVAAIKKYGKENFSFQVLCWCPDKTYADYIERELISAHDTRKTGYNICLGGEGFGSGEAHPCFGRKASESNRRKIAEAKMGAKNHMFGKQNTPEQKAKIRASLLGRQITWGNKISAAKKGSPIHPNTIAARRRAFEDRESGYRLVFTNEKEQVIAKSFAEATRLLGVHDASIRKVLSGKQRSVGGWQVKKVPYGD